METALVSIIMPMEVKMILLILHLPLWKKIQESFY